MTALVVERARQMGKAFEDRLSRAVEQLDAELVIGDHLIRAYACARLLGESAREALLQAHWGRNFREPSAGWNIAYLERTGDEWKARFEAAEDRIREKAARK